MEFGAIHCTPRNPQCQDCAFKKMCVAFRRGIQHELPVKSKPGKPKQRYFYYFIVRKNARLKMSERKRRDIWTGLYDFPLHESKKPLSSQSIYRFLGPRGRNPKPVADSFAISPRYKHVLTHQVIHARFISLHHGKGNPIYRHQIFQNSIFYTVREIGALPKPVLISRYLHDSGCL